MKPFTGRLVKIEKKKRKHTLPIAMSGLVMVFSFTIRIENYRLKYFRKKNLIQVPLVKFENFH